MLTVFLDFLRSFTKMVNNSLDTAKENIGTKYKFQIYTYIKVGFIKIETTIKNN